MSMVNWNLSKVANHEQWFFTAEADNDDFFFGWRKGERVMHPTALCICYGLLAAGISEITAKNAATAYARLTFLERLGERAWRTHDDGTPVWVTPDEVRALIGLKVNATDETDAEWNRRMMKEKMAKLKAEFTAKEVD